MSANADGCWHAKVQAQRGKIGGDDPDQVSARSRCGPQRVGRRQARKSIEGFSATDLKIDRVQ